MFTRVLVANRGEIAVRVIRALHELGIEAVAVYSTADADALHVRLADRAVCVGPPPPADSYLNIPSVVAAAETTGCQAVHPGYGFLAERPEFVRACTDNDLVFVGPDAEVMARMGDKVQAKIAMREAGVPLVPGTEGATTLAQARELAPAIGFPLLLKAAAGGGGRGMRLVGSAEELDAAFATASAEADAAFGDGSLYVEKALVPARHVEIQVLGGRRRRRPHPGRARVLDPAPPPEADRGVALAGPDSRAARGDGGRRRAGVPRRPATRTPARWSSCSGSDGAFYFIELNARLQVEHPVTELVTGIDIVREQLRIAAGERLTATGRAPRSGHAIEIRINAEDPARGLRALTGPDRAPARSERSRRPTGHARRGGQRPSRRSTTR